MPGEVETANWRVLFEELPKAINQLESHDAHHSLEAAITLRTALGVLRARGGARDVYEHLIVGMYKLTEVGDRRQEELPAPTAEFLGNLHALYYEWEYDYTSDEDVIERLSKQTMEETTEAA